LGKKARKMLDEFVMEFAIEGSLLCDIELSTTTSFTTKKKFIWIDLYGEEIFPKTIMCENLEECYYILYGLMLGIYASEKLQLKFRSRTKVPVKIYRGWIFEDAKESTLDKP